MSTEAPETKPQPNVGHEIGEHNIRVLGLDIHNPVFLVSAVLAVALVVGTLNNSNPTVP